MTVVENPIPGPAPDHLDPPTPPDPAPPGAGVVPDPAPDPGEGAETSPRGAGPEIGGPGVTTRNQGAGAGVERERGVDLGVRKIKRGVRALNVARGPSLVLDLDPGPEVSTVVDQIEMRSRTTTSITVSKHHIMTS